LTIVTGALLIISVVGPNAATMLRSRLRRRRPAVSPAAGG
jgi:rhamnose transport system permease protein